eukprot:CAMPEP_0185773708 /NCGR_PEP_ID=MMETSP1174-20130828/74729_1 /TAXON_ID=35687 /ORGANISM="Dictyocha speculum, Strain CCMP1381" /LENGTH=100 /DNA_ID=CAMNT_0028460503 /DNA_START=126 /DNA_END=425 /DNA_ORIENTATION=-
MTSLESVTDQIVFTGHLKRMDTIKAIVHEEFSVPLCINRPDMARGLEPAGESSAGSAPEAKSTSSAETVREGPCGGDWDDVTPSDSCDVITSDCCDVMPS